MGNEVDVQTIGLLNVSWLDAKSEDRSKVGKAVLSYEAESKRIMGTFVANITLWDDLVSGKANIVAMYHGRALYNETFDVCDMSVKVIKCPIKKGTLISVHESKKFPTHIPKGYFVAVGRVVNQDNKCLGKIEAEFEI